ncbi:MAG: hydroxymethylglutaryl-CoA lyase [Erythrobacter sp.]
MVADPAMARITIVEVAPRDGLQNEAAILGTAAKLALINRLIGAGARRLEVASFVNPARVPQMADAESVVAALPDHPDLSYIGLVLNKRGVMRALATRDGGRRGVDEVGCVLAASDGFGLKNQGQTIAQGIAETRAMIRFARDNGMAAQVTIAAAFGCPFEGAVPPARVIEIAEAVLEAGPCEIALADTIGVAVPRQVGDLFGALRMVTPPAIPMRAHFHNTRGTGIANAWAAIEAGVEVLDASLGGIGGCPFAPRAAGNIATEELVYLAQQSGIDHGMDLAGLIAANRWLAGVLGRELPSLVARAATE